jgi:hypothetical protein
MSTENVKILLRRGFRDEIASTTLDTGEMGFATDTNQLFIGIDPAINEIQFDPFVNAHAVIQSWLNSDDCSVQGLTVDEDLVIRNIPMIEENGEWISSIGKLLDSMYFFTQSIELTSDSGIDLEIGELLYQKRYQHDNVETVLSELEPDKVYRIFNLGDTDWLGIEGETNKTYTIHDKIIVRQDFVQWKSDLEDDEDDYDWGTGNAVKVAGVLDYTKGKIVSKTDNKLTLTLSEMDNDFVQEIPPSGEKYYNFNGNPAAGEPDDTLGELVTDFGLFEYSSGSWNQVVPTQLDNDDDIADINSDGIAPPKDTYGEDNEYVVVTSIPKITYWKKIEGSWKLLGDPIFEQETVVIIPNNSTHTISDSLSDRIASDTGTVEVTITRNIGTDNETINVLSPDDFTIDEVNKEIDIPSVVDLDSADDTLVIEYIYGKDFQFSNVENPSHRSDSTDLQDGDCYIYTNRDIVGGLELNMFKWDGSDFKHNYIPAYETDAFAVANASPGVLIYGKASGTEGIIELRQRNRNGQFWFEFITNPIHMFYLSTNPIGSVNDNDTEQTISITDSSDFSAGYLGRPRTNVEVVTENTFNQLFADQHLSSLDVALGTRPSLFRKTLKQRIHSPDKLKFGLEYKILDVGTNTDAQLNWNTVAGTTGVTYAVDDTFTAVDQVVMETGQGSALTTQGTFLRYNKHICTTFFIDYSLVQTKVQTDGTEKKFLRVGQIKVINGIPQGIDRVKLTDDNTEMWQDTSDDTIAGLDEFSNIEFESAIEKILVDGEEIIGDNIEINFTQNENFTTEVSYTVKRWSM